MQTGKIYYGWFIVGAAMLVYTLVIGSTFGVFGLLVQPVSAELGLSRADMNTALILLNLGNGALAPFIGRLLDRLPARVVMSASARLIGGSLAALSISHSVLLSAAVIAVPLSAGVMGGALLTMSVLIARWFTVHRGRAMTLAVIGVSLGSVLVTPVAAWLIGTLGWRSALLILGGAVTLILLGLAMLIRERPEPGDIESPTLAGAGAPAPAPAAAQGGGTPLAPPTVGSLLRMPLFWALGLSVALGLTGPQAVGISLVPLALEKGLSMMQAASIVSIGGGTAIAGKLLLAFIADKLDRTVLLAGMFAMVAVPIAMLLVSDGFTLLLLASAIIGLTTGALTPIYYTLLADTFGVTAFGTVRGVMVPITASIGAVAVRFIGEVFDRTGGYAVGFAIFIGIQLLAAALLFSTRYMRRLPIAAG